MWLWWIRRSWGRTSDLREIYAEASDASQPQPMNRCIDSDDPLIELPKICKCPDPVKPISRAIGTWAVHHRNMVAQVQTSASSTEVVFLGDSITEHWNATKQMGSVPLDPAYRELFQKYFGPFHALALGAAGDTSTELLWHLQHGMLPDLLQPKVFVLLIGTNDLGRNGCSKRTTLAGILNLANWIHEQRPRSIILMHGLLPRSGPGPEKEELGRYWDDIQWVNQELERFCKVHPGEWYYFDASDVFLLQVRKGDWIIDIDLMEDGLHPNLLGRQKWAPFLAKQVEAILDGKDPREVSDELS